MKDDRIYLQHIRDALDDIAIYTSAGRDAFFAERIRQDATIRKLQVIGQAVKNLSVTPKLQQPHIPWKQIAGLRDKVIHDLFTTTSVSISTSYGKSSSRTCQCSGRPSIISSADAD